MQASKSEAGFTLDLPLPPSLNSLYPGKERRRKSRAYKAWLTAAGWEAKLQKVWPVSGPYTLDVRLPKAMPGDASNRIKPIEDLLVSLRLTPDDRYCQRPCATRDAAVLPGRCRVIVRTAGAEAGEALL